MNDAETYQRQASVLNPKTLMDEAQALTGLSDFGGTRFYETMPRLLDRAAKEVAFNPDGLLRHRADVLRHMVNRLRTQEDIRRHPEILEEDVSDPVIIIGLPRSGTTKLQRMMAEAPNVQKLYMWRMLNPARFPDADPNLPDPRLAAAGIDGNVVDTGSVRAAHAMAASLVEEEFVLFDFLVDETITGWESRLPLFHTNWAKGGDCEADFAAYEYVKTLLQYLQWQDGGKRNRPWIMKSVSHMPHIEALTTSFPNATLVHCHRDPRDSIPSVAKLMWAIWNTSMDYGKESTGEKFLTWGSIVANRYLDERKRLNLDERILDVKYERVRDDIMPVIREIYDRAGWELTNEAQQSMIKWETGNEQGKHGGHTYSLEEFGLSEKIIDQAFARYIDHFIDR